MKLATFFRASVFLSLLMGIAQWSQAQSVSVYLKPSTDAYLVTSIPDDDERLAFAEEMMQDPNTGDYWRWFELSDNFEGYVRKAYVTKGLTLKANAPIYFQPGDEESFITLADEGTQATVIEAAGDWIKVDLTTSLPVYFASKKPFGQASITSSTPEPDQDIVVADNAPAADPDYQIEDSTVSDDFNLQNPSDLEGAILDPATGGPIDRILEGVLKPWKPAIPNPFSKPKYKWQIVDKRGKRLAFVDPRNLVPRYSLSRYSNRSVTIKGTLYRVNRGKDILVLANFISLQ